MGMKTFLVECVYNPIIFQTHKGSYFAKREMKDKDTLISQEGKINFSRTFVTILEYNSSL